MAEGGKATLAQKPQTRVHRLRIETHSRVEFKDVTDLIRKCIVQSQVESGVCHVFVPHTSAAVLIQENDDPALRKDLDAFLEKLKDYGRTHPDFVPILTRYGLISNAPPAAAPVPSANQPSSAPKK